jgi:predicted TIM-barrel fold metal-dependent hydrolase
MQRRRFLQAVGAAGATPALAEGARAQGPAGKTLKLDLHTHYYPEAFFQKIRDTPGEFTFDKDPTGRTIIKYRGARFFGIQPPMTDPVKRLADMDRVGIDVEVVSLSTPNVFFADEKAQPEVARLVNDSYAELIARYPGRF